MGYPSSMILLPLILAAATPDTASTAYRSCVLGKARDWATGPDEAQVIVRTAEGMCSRELQALKDALKAYGESRSEASRASPSTVRQFVEAGSASFVEGTRTVAFSEVLQARSKHTR